MKKKRVSIIGAASSLFALVVMVFFFFVNEDGLNGGDEQGGEPGTFITANPINLDQTKNLSLFRSCYGHDFSGKNINAEEETLRSMKHYIEPIEGLLAEGGVVEVYAPFDGEITSINSSPPGEHVNFEASVKSGSGWQFKIFHMNLLPELEKGDKVIAGQLVGYIGQKDVMQVNYDIGMKKFALGGQLNASMFDFMTDDVLAEYAARGITPENIIVSKEARDADPCPIQDIRDGEEFFESHSDQLVEVQPL